jgi:dihydrofolate reductase
MDSIIVIAALTKNRVIGANNRLPWNIPDDRKNFQKLTKGNVVIMGRRTYEAIGHPLAERINIVISSELKNQKGITICRTISHALKISKSFKRDICIIGGSKIYRELLPYADKMILSWVKKKYSGDVFFPRFNKRDWNLLIQKDHKDFTIVEYVRKR